ncbi:ABC transporter permease [Nonomuraea spiralis]|uniref:ABC transporter permease n=1 Tax=Nonomuraea TaxID=83681 RepID=UPI000F786C59|nr:polyketide antibiotic transporter [Nonomuraea sp. WAC 01424]RSN12699.1 polyketide antibiotic transporter [Nonomuraea sp. WAC 01424]
MSPGTGVLVRLALRRERAVAPWWLLLLVALALAMVAYINRNMATYELKLAYTEVVRRYAFFQALGGGYVEPRLEVLATWRSGGFLYVINAFAALMTVVRHTRREEDAGRTELLRAGVVGRRAPLGAALLVAGTTSLAGGALVAAALLAAGLEPAGTLAYGAAVVVAGWVFAGIAAVAAQLVREARTATVIGLYALGLAYVLRYTADASGQHWLKALSPLGWSHMVDAYKDERWWLLGVSALVAGALCAVAYTLAGRRDLGSGLLAERPGRESAPGLRGPVSLAWRLHRGLLLKWAAGTAAFAAVGGAMGPLAKDVLARPSVVVTNITTLLGVSPEAALDGYMWYYLLILAYCIALYPVLMIVRLRSEETSGRAEAVQATPLTRVRWAAGHLVVAALGTAALLALTALVFSAVYGALLGDFTGTAPRFLAAALSQAPAAWCVGAVCLAAYGLVPRASVPLCWAAWILTALLGQVVAPFYGVWGGTPFEPFHYLPNILAGQAFGTVPVLVLLALTAVLTAGGLLALRRRDAC